MAILTNNSTIDDAFPVMIADATLAMIEKNKLSSLFREDVLPLNSGSSRKEVKFSIPTPSYFGEYLPHPEVSLTDTPFTMSTHVFGYKVIVSKETLDFGIAGIMAQITEAVRLGMNRFIDMQVSTLFDGGLYEMPGAGNPVTIGTLLAARARMRRGTPSAADNEVVDGPVFGVLDPFHIHDAKMSLLNADGAGDPTNVHQGLPQDVIKNYDVTNLAGMPIIETTYLQAGSGTSAHSFVGSKNFARILRQGGIERDKDWNKDTRSHILYMSSRAGFGIYKTAFGTDLLADVTDPS